MRSEIIILKQESDSYAQTTGDLSLHLQWLPSKSNQDLLGLNKIKRGIIRKGPITANLTEFETQRPKTIYNLLYIVEQYLSTSHLHGQVKRVGFTTLIGCWLAPVQILSFQEFFRFP